MWIWRTQFNSRSGRFFSLKFLLMRKWTKWWTTTRTRKTTQVIPWSLADGRRQKCLGSSVFFPSSPYSPLSSGWSFSRSFLWRPASNDWSWAAKWAQLLITYSERGRSLRTLRVEAEWVIVDWWSSFSFHEKTLWLRWWKSHLEQTQTKNIQTVLMKKSETFFLLKMKLWRIVGASKERENNTKTVQQLVHVFIFLKQQQQNYYLAKSNLAEIGKIEHKKLIRAGKTKQSKKRPTKSCQ